MANDEAQQLANAAALEAFRAAVNDGRYDEALALYSDRPTNTANWFELTVLGLRAAVGKQDAVAAKAIADTLIAYPLAKIQLTAAFMTLGSFVDAVINYILFIGAETHFVGSELDPYKDFIIACGAEDKSTPAILFDFYNTAWLCERDYLLEHPTDQYFAHLLELMDPAEITKLGGGHERLLHDAAQLLSFGALGKSPAIQATVATRVAPYGAPPIPPVIADPNPA